MGKTSLVSYVFDKPSIAGEYVTITIDILHTTTFREFIMTFGTAVFDAFFSVKRPFYQSAKALRWDAINRDIYRAFATDQFNADRSIETAGIRYVTRQEKVYSLSDPLLSLWLDRR